MNSRFYVQQNRRFIFIDMNSIYYLERRDGNTVIYAGKKTIKTKENLRALTMRLNNKIFLQVHRSYVVNVNKIEKIEPWGDRIYLISFSEKIPDAYMSRKGANIFFRQLRMYQQANNAVL